MGVIINKFLASKPKETFVAKIENPTFVRYTELKNKKWK